MPPAGTTLVSPRLTLPNRRLKPQSGLSLIIAYYLSKFDKQALANLGYPGFNAAYKDISLKIGMKGTSIKNHRDEFDPLHGWRVGWHQREMLPSRLEIVEQLQDLSEPALREIVKDILLQKSDTINQMAELIKPSRKSRRKRKGAHTARTVTGRRAEEIFSEKFHKGLTPFKGKFLDFRDSGNGYDFRIKDATEDIYVEVKGLDSGYGGVGITDKEWKTAQQKSRFYYLVVVSNIGRNPKIDYIQDPYSCLKPVKRIITIPSVSWDVSASQIFKS